MEIGLIVGPLFFIGIFGIFIAIFVFAARTKKKNQAEQKKYDQYRAQNTTSQTAQSRQGGMTDEQRKRAEYLRQQQKQKNAAEKHQSHVQDAHEHAHMGEEEHYDEIIGSLGEVNDEGCEDLSGVRFIVHDMAYDSGDGEEVDYTELAKAMVMGEIINNPRFKSPHNRK
ncbi:MAG: hypothetical protein J1G02_01275 [Clostridiales bacterium]|nr:hypothetical protein [Clostridiales bacterium]